MKSPIKIALAISNIVTTLRNCENNPDGAEREVIAGCYASQIVAYDLPLPSGPVDNPRQWYFDNCMSVVDETLGKINEEVIIDLGSAIRRTQAIWELRYNMLHTAGHPATFGVTLAALTAVGVNDYLSPEYVAIFEGGLTRKDIRDIVYYINEIRD